MQECDLKRERGRENEDRGDRSSEPYRKITSTSYLQNPAKLAGKSTTIKSVGKRKRERELREKTKQQMFCVISSARQYTVVDFFHIFLGRVPRDFKGIIID